MDRIKPGQRVRDLDGQVLGRVTRCDAWGFEFVKGRFYRRDGAAAYAEIREVRDGEVVLSRSARALFDLAAGRIPETWRSSDPPPLVGGSQGVLPGSAAPSSVPRGPKDEFPRESMPYGRDFPVLSPIEERTFVDSSGQRPPAGPVPLDGRR